MGLDSLSLTPKLGLQLGPPQKLLKKPHEPQKGLGASVSHSGLLLPMSEPAFLLTTAVFSPTKLSDIIFFLINHSVLCFSP